MDFIPERVSTALTGAASTPAQGQDNSIIGEFQEFLKSYPHSTANQTYAHQIDQRCIREEYFLEININILRESDKPHLAEQLMQKPARYLPLLNEAARRIASERHEIGSFFVILCPPSPESTFSIRQLSDSSVGSLVAVRGLALQSSRVTSVISLAVMQCRACQHIKSINIDPIQILTEGGRLTMPLYCESDGRDRIDRSGPKSGCGMNPYLLLHNRSRFVDFQTIHLQETHDDLGVGDIPRHLRVVMINELVNKVKPGMNVVLFGIHQAGAARKDDTTILPNFIAAVGVREEGTSISPFGLSSSSTSLMGIGIGRGMTMTDEERFKEYSRNPDIFHRIAASIEPAIFGHEVIKEAIAALLFGGRRKELPDGMRIRGDINVLLLGDPGTAKSQFLKFVQQVAPLCVFTSGKGSSAAGLTASVTKESSSGEWYLEGGAMVLADGGVVCIDEFDKMNEEDRVAIHEAMEQQTISIAKAGITTVLNSRCSVLAAANPVFGTFDDFKSASENIDFQTTILSRFDLIFLIRDIIDEAKDRAIATRVIQVRREEDQAAVQGPMELDFLRRYIAFARRTTHPVLSDEAARVLQDGYVEMRDIQKRRKAEEDELFNKGLSTRAYKHIPVTVRQLEACVRLSEAYARMQLSGTVTAHHAKLAMELFRKANDMSHQTSTMGAQSSLSSAMQLPQSGGVSGALLPGPMLFRRVEDEIRLQLRVGAELSTAVLMTNVQTVTSADKGIIKRVIESLIQREELEQRAMGKKVLRRK